MCAINLYEQQKFTAGRLSKTSRCIRRRYWRSGPPSFRMASSSRRKNDALHRSPRRGHSQCFQLFQTTSKDAKRTNHDQPNAAITDTLAGDMSLPSTPLQTPCGTRIKPTGATGRPFEQSYLSVASPKSPTQALCVRRIPTPS